MKQSLFTVILLIVAVGISSIIFFFFLPEFITRGGPVVILLITVTIMLVAYIVERILTLNKARGKAPIPNFYRSFIIAVKDGKYDEAMKICEKQRGSAAAVLKAGLETYQRGLRMNMSGDKRLAETQRSIEEARLLEVPFLERNLFALSTIASVSTMLGLLGTTIGMIRAFAAMAHQGAPDAIQLATGISEALINTAGGLFAAIVGIVSYNIFVNLVDSFNYSVDEGAFMFMEIIKEKEAQ
ncbi:MAG: MotA/TolQ/ExbB proton channel family protein [Candidatus Zixiibacteriota bacterium]|nr:MAG: MotA/TolQ/ExbB proton channel family protein [candidate division Zixibacteria bacterium]